MSLSTYALFPTIAPVKQFLGVEDSKDDRAIERIVEGVSRAIEKLADREFIVRERTVILDGNGDVSVALPFYPIAAITYVYLYRTATDDGTALSSDYYEWDTNRPEQGGLYQWPRSGSHLQSHTDWPHHSARSPTPCH